MRVLYVVISMENFLQRDLEILQFLNRCFKIYVCMEAITIELIRKCKPLILLELNQKDSALQYVNGIITINKRLIVIELIRL